MNPNGIAFRRVNGRLNGLRIRKNFKTRAETGAEKASLEAKAAHTISHSKKYKLTALTANER